MSLEGTVINGVIVLDEAEKLTDGTRVEVVVKPTVARKPTLSERLLKHAGTVPDLPADMAERHDHFVDDYDPRAAYPLVDKTMADADADDPTLESYQHHRPEAKQ